MPATGILCAVLVPPSEKQCRSAGEDLEKGRVVRGLEQLPREEGLFRQRLQAGKEMGRKIRYRSWKIMLAWRRQKEDFSLIFLCNMKIREHQIKLIETRFKGKKSSHNLASVLLLTAGPCGS